MRTLQRRYWATPRGCLQSCLAGLLGLPLEAVPHIDEWSAEGHWEVGFKAWLHSKTDYTYLSTKEAPDFYHVEVYLDPDTEGAHAVVSKGMEVVHNPSPKVKCPDDREVLYRLILVRR